MIIASRYALFNNWNFNNVPGLQVYSIDPPGQGQRTVNALALARRSARKVSSAFYQANSFNVGVYIVAATRDALEQAMDTLYANIQAVEGSLVVPQSGNVRQYTATYSGTMINNKMPYSNSPSSNMADLTLVFQLSDNFGYATNYLTLIPASPANTSGNRSDNVPFIGGADGQVPFIEHKFTALSPNASDTVTVGNGLTAQTIAVTRTFKVGDIFQVDCRNKTVQVNGVDVNFVGAWPEFAPGVIPLTYQDTFISRTDAYFGYYYPRWN